MAKARTTTTRTVSKTVSAESFDHRVAASCGGVPEHP
jgi:hypothetical protein